MEIQPVLHRLLRLSLLLLFLGPVSTAALTLNDYLPDGVRYSADIPTPRESLGYEVGEWHVRHDQLLAYMRRLAASSDRVELQEIGRTHEHRPLIQLLISSPANLQRLDEIRAEHQKLSQPDAGSVDTSSMPVVVNLGYSVHGNEPSGSNASLVVAYHLAAAQGPAMEEMLDNMVVILDPSLNPDGLSRFAQWANMHRGTVLVADPNHREHQEAWPSGRTNHYWFDLNRDWLLAQHPESQARLRSFHRWMPNVLTDFHEMDTGSTYFFQPGVPSRQNPLTPSKNLELTRQFATYHARALDAIGSLYFTEERFDDFYFGKGSTYPDLQGAVGILFSKLAQGVTSKIRPTANSRSRSRSATKSLPLFRLSKQPSTNAKNCSIIKRSFFAPPWTKPLKETCAAGFSPLPRIPCGFIISRKSCSSIKLKSAPSTAIWK